MNAPRTRTSDSDRYENNSGSNDVILRLMCYMWVQETDTLLRQPAASQHLDRYHGARERLQKYSTPHSFTIVSNKLLKYYGTVSTMHINPSPWPALLP